MAERTLTVEGMQTWSSVDVPRIPGTPRPLRLHDTATGQIRPTAPGATARMYVCGITPYDATHLGHAATYLAFDLVNRIWRDNGHDVHYVQNVTDIDEPLLERAQRDQDDWVVLGMRETALFREDMVALRVLPPKQFVGAVESIPEIVEVIAKLLANGAAYRADDLCGVFEAGCVARYPVEEDAADRVAGPADDVAPDLAVAATAVVEVDVAEHAYPVLVQAPGGDRVHLVAGLPRSIVDVDDRGDPIAALAQGLPTHRVDERMDVER